MQLHDTKLLLVDDDPGILRLLSRWLEKAGYPVAVASDGAEALAAIEKAPPDLVITDWEIPRMDGLELCRRLRQMDLPHYIYTIVLSVKAAPDESAMALEAGADDFVGKPVHQGELLGRVRAGTRMLALERRLSQLASTDPLTGLMTQRSFYEGLAKEWQRTLRHRLPMSCVMLDIDFFKRINDTHGHPAGDTVLKRVAQTLAENCRPNDFLCRYGGEEFCAVLPEMTGEHAALWAERVRRRVSTLAIPLGKETLQITASFGAAERHEDTQTVGQLVDQADQALLCAKHSGRDRVARFEALTDARDLPFQGDPVAGQALKGVTAAEVMAPLIAWLSEDETLGNAVELFLRTRTNSLAVVNAQGELVGIVSEKDVMPTAPALTQWDRPIREIMRPNVICYEEGTPLRVVYEFLSRVAIRRVIIVTPDRRPVGTIGRSTLLRWFRDLVVAGSGTAGEGDLFRGGPPDSFSTRLATVAQEVAELQQQAAQGTGMVTSGMVNRIAHLEQAVQELLVGSDATVVGDPRLWVRNCLGARGI